MAAMVSKTSAGSSCSSAAACTSARNIPVVDTAIIPAVSICILPLLRIRRRAA